MRNLVIAATLLAVGLMFFTTTSEPTPPVIEAETVDLVVESSPWILASTYGEIELVENIQTPIADPVPDNVIQLAPRSTVTDELKELSRQMAADAAEIREQSKELRNLATSATQATADPACECNCDCDCPNEDMIRTIFREEMATALKARMTATASTSGGSSGGTVTAAATYVPRATQSGGSTGGDLAMQQQTMPPTANPRMLGERLGREPLKVTIHTFASGQNCPACTRWLTEVAPQLQAQGVLVTQVADITNSSAPVLDVCKGRDVCQRFLGYTDAATIMAALR